MTLGVVLCRTAPRAVMLGWAVGTKELPRRASQINCDSQVQYLAFLRWSCYISQEKWQRRVANALKPIALGDAALWPYPFMGKASGVNTELTSGDGVPNAVCC